MSDGPLRSLDMRRHWKRLAKCTSNDAFDNRERSEALTGALQGDWRLEVPERFTERLRHILDDHQGDLLGEPATKRLEALRRQTAGHPLAGTVLDCAIQALHDGYSGDEALIKAAQDAFLDRAASGRRQVEEHWLRESSTGSAECVSNRIDDAIAASDMNAIARRCLSLDDDVASRAPLRKAGIDDGVSLS